MHNSFENLQRKCKSYTLKQRLKVVIPSLVVLVIVILSGYVFMQKEEHKVVKLSLPIKKQTVEKLKTDTNITNTTVFALKPKGSDKKKNITVKESQKILKDVTYFMKVDDSYVASEETAAPTKKKKIFKKQKKKIEPKKVIEKKDEITKKDDIKKVDEKKVLNMSVKNISSVEDMESMYKKEKKYALALKIGQKYYEQHKYSKSLFWSKEANLLNHKAEGAWILYAKSEYAKGNKKRAIKILNLYRGNTNSQEADSLVMKWMESSKK